MRALRLDNGGQGCSKTVMANQTHDRGEPPKLDNGCPASRKAVGEPEKRVPLYGLTHEQEARFFSLADRLRALGYFVNSEPLEGRADEWLAGIERNLARINERLADVQKAYRARGLSKRALYHLTSADYFDPGFGIKLTADRREENRKYAAETAKAVARWDAAFGEGNRR